MIDLLKSPMLFLWLLTIGFAFHAIRNVIALDWPQVLYGCGAVALQLAVIWMGTK